MTEPGGAGEMGVATQSGEEGRAGGTGRASCPVIPLPTEMPPYNMLATCTAPEQREGFAHCVQSGQERR